MSEDHYDAAVSITQMVNLALVDPDAEESVVSTLRMNVHQAAGMVMQQGSVGIHDALILLKATAFAENIQVTDLANDVITRRRRFGQSRLGQGGRDDIEGEARGE